MREKSSVFIKQLKNEAVKIINDAEVLKQYSYEQLSQRANSKSWNVLECLEHMNKYHEYYLPEIKHAIAGSKHNANDEFKSGWLGNYSAKNMLPKKENKVNMPMKTFKDMDPMGQALKLEVLDVFLNQMRMLLQIIDQSAAVDLSKTKVKLTIRFLKFSLGDTLHFLINHNRRHMIQIKKIVKGY